MDFYKIKERPAKNGVIEVYPDFVVCRSKDLMIRARSFYAIWDEASGLWSTDEYDVQRLVDEKLLAYADVVRKRNEGVVRVKTLRDFSSGSWREFQAYLKNLSDSAVQLDSQLTFQNSEVKKSDYVSKRLPYAIQSGDHAAYDELISHLYDPSERAKIEWSIGAILSGDAKDIQKFIVLYGSAGTGKSTVLNIIQALFDGYYTTFEAKALTGNNNQFAVETFRGNPLVAIQHDGDLSRIEDNTKLNSLVSHEDMVINEKNKPMYTARINAFLYMGTNKPVKITDAKSGIIRRLIDVQPTGNLLPPSRYHMLYSQLFFELGAIAQHCLDVYLEMGKNYYSGYQPLEMMFQTDVFYNYVEANYDIFKSQDGVTLKQAYELYKQFCEETLVEHKIPQYKFREELRNYFEKFEDRGLVGDTRVRSWYSGFIFERPGVSDQTPPSITMESDISIIDEVLKDRPAQYTKLHKESGNHIPILKWDDVTTTLKDLDTSKLHYVQPPVNHIVIDFDLKDENGKKSRELNLREASKWPHTYAEWSKGGSGVHLHYVYDGDPETLSRIFAPDIEVKVFTGNSSLRRMFSASNGLPISTISGGLPIKERRMTGDFKLESEQQLRALIEKNLRKEIHGGTKPSIDFIHKLFSDAYSSGMVYDLEDLRSRVLSFASASTNQALYCLRLTQTMKFSSDKEPEIAEFEAPEMVFDTEVFPNVWFLNAKVRGPDKSIVRYINPTPQQVEELIHKYRLIGFNNIRYDNHILYAAMMGYTPYQIYQVSQKLIKNDRAGTFASAYGLAYADIYDFAATKQGLKKWQLELGLNHHELGLPWDDPVPEEKWAMVSEYCDNDVVTTEQVLDHLEQDFNARKILAQMSGRPVSATTQQHTAAIIFGTDRNYQESFQYTDLSEELFPGYIFDAGVSTYRGEVVGEGGYVYAEPGMYTDVAVLDVASMHPTSIEELNLFGDYTERYSAIKNARLAIKHRQYDDAKKMLGGVLAPYLGSDEDAEALSYALKIVINIVYGLTSAKFPNPFKDNRNKDNIVAKRGALFMVDLKHFVQERGFQVVHIKTDSIKIPNATDKIIEEVMEFGISYGYVFEHESTYEKFCLVNKAVYIAKTLPGRKPAHWEAVGAQFKHPYVYKTLLTGDPILPNDYKEVKTVTTAIYLHDSASPMHTAAEPRFIGRAGAFVPVREDVPGAGTLLRINGDKYDAVTGTKGYFWKEFSMVVSENGIPEQLDMSYYDALVDDAFDEISKYGDIETFLD